MIGPPGVLEFLDWTIVGAYAAVVVVVAWAAQRKERTSHQFLLAGGRVPSWVIAASLLATSFSSVSLLSLPSDGYLRGFGLLQLWIGELIAALLVVVWFVPVYRRAGVTTAYELLEQRLGRRSRSLASVLFLVFTLLRAGFLLLLTAKAVEIFTGLDLTVSILFVGLGAMIYSTMGGLGAVVWTDVVQLGLVITGLGAAACLLLHELPGGLGAVLAANSAAQGRPPVDLSLALDHYPSLFSGAVAYVVPLLYVSGTNQQMVQRYAACGSAAAARRAVLGAWALGAGVAVLAVFLGATLFARVGGGYAEKDQELLTFLVRNAPVGVGGVMAAAIFAAAMSSVDSAVHAMATSTLVDGVEAFRRLPLTEGARLRVVRALTLGFGVLATAAALALSAGAFQRTVFQQLVDWLALFSGPGLGLFLLAMARRRPPESAVLVGVALGFLATSAAWKPWLPMQSESLFATWQVGGVWKGAFGLAVTMGGAWAVAPLLRGRHPPREPRATT